MWLINTNTLTLENFQDISSVDYAILSHTWASDEVSFQDLADLSIAKAKTGFTKIQRTCQKAEEEPYCLKYAWIDTCCIDKTSSSELSEAINSMFLWYKRAKICFAFLSDLGPIPQSDQVRKTFFDCRWFTRGWTLQELIAPKELYFFDGDWRQYGTKTELQEALAEYTGIEECVLRDTSWLRTVPVGRRMSWATGRQATRVEDLAYCLMGIFDVNMPMIYGEGSKAFLRLQEAILNKTGDLSLFAWKLNQPPAPAATTASFDAGGGIVDTHSTCRGLLASSPAEFSNCRYLKSTQTQFQFRDEITLTNKGIRFQGCLYPTGRDGLYTMSLCCHSEIGDGTLVDTRIYLRRMQDTFVRAKPWEIYRPPIHLAPIGHHELVYGQPTMEGQRMPASSVSKRGISIKFHQHRASVVNVKASPAALWDPSYRFFFIENLVEFTGLVRFSVSLPRGSFAGPFLVVVYVTAKSSIPFCGIYEPAQLEGRLLPSRYVSPFRRFEDYPPWGDQFSMSFITNAVCSDGRSQQMELKQTHPTFKTPLFRVRIRLERDKENLEHFELLVHIDDTRIRFKDVLRSSSILAGRNDVPETSPGDNGVGDETEWAQPYVIDRSA